MLVVLLAWTGAEAAAIGVTLTDDTTVTTRVYSLAQVATVRGERGIVGRVAAVELGRAPRPGHWVKLTRHEIAARLERVIPGISRQLTWSGAESVRVAAVGVAYPGSLISEFATEVLRTALYRRYDRVDIELTSEPDDIIVPAGKLELAVSGLEDIIPTKRMVVWVDAQVDGEHYQSLPVWYGVTIQADVVTAARDLKRHEVVASSDLRTANVDITTVRGTPVVDPNELVGLRVLIPIAAGDVLLDGIAEPPPAIQEGQMIDVVASSGRVILRGKAIALADGDLHERIAVRNPKSGESYFATVTGPGHVRAN